MNFAKTFFSLSMMSILATGCDSENLPKTQLISIDLDENSVHSALLTPDTVLRSMADLRQYKAYVLSAESDTLAVSDIKDEFEFLEGENELVFTVSKELFKENGHIVDGVLHVYQLGKREQVDTLRLTQKFLWQYD